MNAGTFLLKINSRHGVWTTRGTKLKRVCELSDRFTEDFNGMTIYSDLCSSHVSGTTSKYDSLPYDIYLERVDPPRSELLLQRMQRRPQKQERMKTVSPILRDPPSRQERHEQIVPRSAVSHLLTAGKQSQIICAAKW